MRTHTDPQRMCVSCRRRASQASLLRLQADHGEPLQVAQFERQGRGVYVCPTAQCLQQAATRGGWARGLKRAVTAPDVTTLVLQAQQQTQGRLARRGRDQRAEASPQLAWLDEQLSEAHGRLASGEVMEVGGRRRRRRSQHAGAPTKCPARTDG